ncbi:MAG TPA: class II aldolase/adducin family protein [Candidatus Binatia bacterium]|nr:class II aldolase/adducin family protein [Candidatus Binatia bacterium]
MNQAIVEDLVTASHILAGPGVLDGLASLGESAVVLLRGHGNAVVGETLQQVVYRAIQTELNARLQLQAMMLDGLELFGAGRSGKGERPLRTRTPFK